MMPMVQYFTRSPAEAYRAGVPMNVMRLYPDPGLPPGVIECRSDSGHVLSVLTFEPVQDLPSGNWVTRFLSWLKRRLVGTSD